MLKRDATHGIYFVAKKDGRPLLGSKHIYLIDPTLNPSLILKYRNVTENPFAILHDGYETSISRSEGIERRKNFASGFCSPGTRASPLFQFLLMASNLAEEWTFLHDRDVVDLLYAVRFHVRNSNQPPKPKLIKAVGELEVTCLDGRKRLLGGLALPNGRPQAAVSTSRLCSAPKPNAESSGISYLYSELSLRATRLLGCKNFRALSELPAENIDRKTSQ